MENEILGKRIVSSVLTDSGIKLELESLNKPDTFITIHSSNTHKIAGTTLENFVLGNNINNRQLSFLAHNSRNNNIYDFLIDEQNDINQHLHSITKNPEEEFVIKAKHIFSLVKDNNISLNIAKRLAVQMLIQVYDYYKNANILFEAIISEQTITTQLHISLSTTIEDIERHTISALKLLHTHYVKSQKPATDSLLLTKIITLISENFADPQLSLDYISKETGISTFAISKIFQQKLKIKYIDYVTNIRIDYAKQLLEQTNLSLTEICSKVGYSDQSTFFRAFKKITKETPAQYKRRIKQ